MRHCNMRYLLIITLLLAACGSQSDAAILVKAQNGTYSAKASLLAAATAADAAGKTVIVTSALSAVMSNISSATVHSWPADRKLVVEKGGSIGNTTIFKFADGAPFEAGRHTAFAGTGRVQGITVAYPEWWGAKADNLNTSITANNTALQAAFTACKTVILSTGVYKFSASLTLQENTTLKGQNEYTSELVYTGTGDALTLQGGYFQGYDFMLRGLVVAPSWFTAGTRGIYSDSLLPEDPYFGQNIVLHNVRLQNFEKLIQANGFYWKFYNCSFMFSKYALYEVSSNNLLLSGCRFAYGEDFISSIGGNGPITMEGGSFEAWSGSAILPILGGTLDVNLVGNYIENYPDTDLTGTGLTGDFTAAFVITGAMRGVHSAGNTVQCKGIRRPYFITSAGTVSSSDNTFFYDDTAGASSTEYLYSIANTTSFSAKDTAVVMDDGGTYGTYTTGVNVSATYVFGLNPITNVFLQKSTFTLTGTGFSGDAPTGTASYNLQSGIVVLDFPQVTGTSNATTFTLTGMPSTVRPTATRTVFARVTNNGGAITTGLATIATNGVITLSSTVAGGAWTASGTKSIEAISVSYIK